MAAQTAGRRWTGDLIAFSLRYTSAPPLSASWEGQSPAHGENTRSLHRLRSCVPGQWPYLTVLAKFIQFALE